jgi:hypothetical protein
MRIATASIAILITTVSALSLLPAQTAPARTRDPFILADTTEKLSPHVFVIPDKDTTPSVPNVGFVVGSSAALVIETGLGYPNGAIVLSEALSWLRGARSTSSPPMSILNTIWEPTPSPPQP